MPVDPTSAGAIGGSCRSRRLARFLAGGMIGFVLSAALWCAPGPATLQAETSAPAAPAAADAAPGAAPVPERGAAGETAHTFRYAPDPAAPAPRPVHLAGEFNGWSKDATPMQRQPDGSYAATVPLREGLHLYKFVIDGDRWISDPAADKQLEVDDNYGGRNSGVIIGPDVRKAPPPRPDHINAQFLFHNPDTVDDANVTDDGRLRLRVRAQAGEVQQVDAVVHVDGRSQTTTLSRLATTGGLDVFGGLVPAEGTAATYAFSLTDGTARRLLSATGAHVPEVQLGGDALFRKPLTNVFDVPDWAKHAVWYQIFPERFRNGDPSNDPPGTQRWQSDWWSTLPGEKPGADNFYTGAGNVWQRRYGGDLQGARAALPYLKKLGINAIYFNPIFEAESMHKYDTADFRHVDDNFGVKGDIARLEGETDDPATWQWTETDKLFLDFLADAHAQGFKVIIDGVFNHVGRAHPLFQDVVKHGRDSKYADWFEIESFADYHPADPAQFGKPGGFRFKAWDGPSGHLPTFKKDAARGLAPGPHAHVMAITKRWLAPDGDPSRGIDGWRLDVPGDIPHPFWKDWRKLCKQTDPDCYLTGEIWGWAQPWLAGDEFDAVMNYQFAMPALDFVADQRDAISPTAFGAAMHRVAFAYPFQVALVQQNLFDSHDTDRLASMFVNPDRPYDQANRLQDSASSYDRRRPNDEERRRMLQAVAMQMTFVGAPMIYYGNEAGMWSPDDPSNRQPMVWPDHEPFDSPQVRFDQPTFDGYQRLIAARATLPALRLGFFRTLLADDATGVYAFARELGDDAAYVVLNRSGETREVRVPLSTGPFGGRTWINWLDGEHADLAPGDDGRPVLRARAGVDGLNITNGAVRLRMAPYGSAIVSASTR